MGQLLEDAGVGVGVLVVAVDIHDGRWMSEHRRGIEEPDRQCAVVLVRQDAAALLRGVPTGMGNTEHVEAHAVLRYGIHAGALLLEPLCHFR